MTLPIFDGIAGLTGREPIGGVLRIGRKGPSGAPIQTKGTDARFYVCSTGLDAQKVRPLHPAFAMYNTAENSDGTAPNSRRIIRGNLYHATKAEAFNHKMQAYKLPGWESPPSREPVCSGDGEHARRWYADKELEAGGEWREQKGCGALCEYRQKGSGKHGAKACPGANLRLYFRVRWQGDDMPSILLRFASNSINSAAHFKGFFESVEKIADELNLERFSLFGLPFMLELTTKTKPQEKKSFPVVTMTPDGDLIDFFRLQRLAIEAAGGSMPKLIGARSNEENAPEVIEADHIELSAPGVPGEQASLID